MASKVLSDEGLLKLVDQAFDEAFDLVQSVDGWKEDNPAPAVLKSQHGEVVMSKKKSNGKKVYRIKGIIDAEPSKLIDVLKDSEKLTSWNKTLLKHDILKRLSDKVVISYQVTPQEGPGGIISPRDFILVFKTDYVGDEFVQAGCSIDYPGPKSSKFVRAWNGPGAMVVKPIPGQPKKSDFAWLLDCDFRGWLPSSILEVAMPVAQLRFLECVHNLAKTL